MPDRKSWTQQRQSRSLADDRRVGVHTKREIQRLQRKWLRDHWRFPAAVATAAILVGAALWWILPDGPALFALGFVAASTGWAIYTFMIQAAGIAPKKIGVEAEGWTAQELRRLQREGWKLVNHVMLESRDIDHAAIGPRGLYAIETKYRSNWAAAEREFGWWARRVRDDARELSFRLGLKGQGVTPVVAVWTSGLYGTPEKPFHHDGVLFCPGRQLRQHLQAQPVSVKEHELDAMYEQLAVYVNRRDLHEATHEGPAPRTLDAMYNDFAAVVLTACGAFLAVILPAQIPPSPWWTLVAAAMVFVTAWLIRHRYETKVRVRLAATAALATSAGLVTAGLAITLISLLAQ